MPPRSFELTDSFCLMDLTALELYKYVDDVGEVVDRAQKEDKMEQSLAKLNATWSGVDFEFDQHRDTPVHLLRMKEEVRDACWKRAFKRIRLIAFVELTVRSEAVRR